MRTSPLRQFRQRQHLTCQQVAQRTGYSTGTLYGWESQQNPPAKAFPLYIGAAIQKKSAKGAKK